MAIASVGYITPSEFRAPSLIGVNAIRYSLRPDIWVAQSPAARRGQLFFLMETHTLRKNIRSRRKLKRA